jgi:hypothetical protein
MQRETHSGLKSMKTVADKSAKPVTIKATEEDKERFEKPFICVTCGKRYKAQKHNFSYSQSPLFEGNNHFLPTCCNCIDKLVEQYTEILGSQDEAIKRICMKYDIYFSQITLDSTKKISSNRSRIKNYIKSMNLQQNQGKTFDTYLKENTDATITSVEELEQMKADGQTSVTKAMFDRWGQVSPEDMTALDEHYKMLKKQNPNCDSNQEIFIKDLCYTKVSQLKAFREGNSTDFEKYTKLYRDTFKQAGLKIAQETDSGIEETLGVTLALISQYTPEEYYKDKKLYKDFDGLGEYFDRFVRRPLKNLVIGETERDSEYSIKDNEDDE